MQVRKTTKGQLFYSVLIQEHFVLEMVSPFQFFGKTSFTSWISKPLNIRWQVLLLTVRCLHVLVLFRITICKLTGRHHHTLTSWNLHQLDIKLKVPEICLQTPTCSMGDLWCVSHAWLDEFISVGVFLFAMLRSTSLVGVLMLNLVFSLVFDVIYEDIGMTSVNL